MNEKLQIVFGLVGGLAIFIYGMNMMSECLQKAAGEKMKSILALLTRNPVLGVLAGAITCSRVCENQCSDCMAQKLLSGRVYGSAHDICYRQFSQGGAVSLQLS